MPSYTVAQNTSFLTVASVLQKAISFFYFILIARIIGVDNTGQYFFAITFTTIFIVIADFGLGPVLIREAARYPENSAKYLNTILWTKVLFGAVVYLLVVFFINVLRYPNLTKELVYLSGLTMFFDNLQSVFYSIFRARKNLVYESIGIVCSQFITMVIGSVALFNHWPLIWLIAAYTIPSFLNVIYVSYFVKKVCNLKYYFSWDRHVFKVFIITALPFALAGIIGRLYSYSDSLLMSKILSAKELGWWSVPYKITFAFQFIPAALSASIYPVFSSLYIGDKKQIGLLFEKSWRYLFTIIFPLSLGLLALAEPIITRVYGSVFRPSVAPFKILLISLIFSYLSFITGALLNATNRQKTQTSLMGAALAVNVTLNIVLLPVLGIKGAALSALASSFILWAFGYYFSARVANINHASIIKNAAQTLLPALVMAGIVYFLSKTIHFILVIPIGAVVYFGLLFLTGGIDLNKIRLIKRKVVNP